MMSLDINQEGTIKFTDRLIALKAIDINCFDIVGQSAFHLYLVHQDS